VRIIEEVLLDITSRWVENMKSDTPAEYHQEIQGIYEGCLAANPDTKVTVKHLWELSVGTDAILSHMYTGELLARVVSSKFLKVPLHCNSFMAPGDNHRRLYGRDFIFPTADVYQDVACLIVYRPETGGGRVRHGFVSQTAPGLIGSVAGLNSGAVAIGINMSASRLCNPHRPGFNGLLLNRHCMELAGSARAAVELVLGAQRGVSWVYPIGDASGDAFVVEAGMKLEKKRFPYLDYIPHYYRRHLPRLRYIRKMQAKYGHKPPEHGAFVRTADYHYPAEYIQDWNERLWKAFDRNPLRKLMDVLGDVGAIVIAIFTGKWKSLFPRMRVMMKELVEGVPWSAGYFGPRDFISSSWKDRHCPGPFYFSPQRESRPGVIVATNNFISPEMRLVGMNTWTAIVAASWYDDFQWRYDELNKELLEALDAHPDGLDDATAWSLINFLTPSGRFAEYYKTPGQQWQDVQVHGSVTLCDLTARKMKSLFGYYGDDPVTITLPKYLG
jgi:hypothetical protein